MRCRNCRVRSSRGALKICSGGPCSRITPASRKQTRARDVAGEAHLVRRDHHRHPAGGELADHVEHLGHELRVERARDLVEEDELRLHRERAHDRDPLLLAAGEAVGVLVPLVGEPEPLEERDRLGLRLAPRLPERLPRPERHVREHGHVREEVERLEDDPDPAADRVDVDVPGRDLVPADDDPARLRRARAG